MIVGLTGSNKWWIIYGRHGTPVPTPSAGVNWPATGQAGPGHRNPPASGGFGRCPAETYAGSPECRGRLETGARPGSAGRPYPDRPEPGSGVASTLCSVGRFRPGRTGPSAAKSAQTGTGSSEPTASHRHRPEGGATQMVEVLVEHQAGRAGSHRRGLFVG